MSHNAQTTRFLSRSDCEALCQRASRMIQEGGVELNIRSNWRGSTKWSRNRVVMSGETRNDAVELRRWLSRGALGIVDLNMVGDPEIDAAIRRAERLANKAQILGPAEMDLRERAYREHDLQPAIWSDDTYTLDADARGDLVQQICTEATREGLTAFGYIEVSAHGQALMSSDTDGWNLYDPFTKAQCSMTVRDPKTGASGWAGQDHYAWERIDANAIARRAIEKCLNSRNPVAVEPGRYTAILEPQAVADFIGVLFHGDAGLERLAAEDGILHSSPFDKVVGESRLGDQVFDERLRIRIDPMDPDLGFAPWKSRHAMLGVDWYHPVTWVEKGVLQALSYHREYAFRLLGKPNGIPSNGAYRMETTSPASSIDDMIASTRRGILVTRFFGVHLMDKASWTQAGMTRDGLWLIENGKISKSIKNFRFFESVMAKLNAPNLEMIGAPVRVFSPEYPVMTPPVKVRDFNFTALVDAV